MTSMQRVAGVGLALLVAVHLAGCGVAELGKPLLQAYDPLYEPDFVFPDKAPAHAVAPEIVASPLYQELDRLHAEGGPDAVLPRIAQSWSDPEAYNAYTFWLRDHFMLGRAPEALYGLFYYRALARMVDPGDLAPSQEAMFDTTTLAVFLSSELIALENVARCAAQPNGTRYRQQWRLERGGNAYLKRLWEAMDERRRRYSVHFAKARVESAESRPPSRAACGSNAMELSAARDAGLCQQVDPGAETRPEFAGGSRATFEACDTRRFISYVDDSTWEERRERLRAQYWESLARP